MFKLRSEVKQAHSQGRSHLGSIWGAVLNREVLVKGRRIQETGRLQTLVEFKVNQGRAIFL